jgi:DNA-binding NarL/FixJ family response regulator
MNVVLIEDETLVRQMLRTTIQKAGGALKVVAEFGDGKEGLDYCLEHKPDLAVIDLGLPSMHGLEVIKVLKEKAPEIKILVLTSSTGSELPVQFVSMGVQGYVDKTKPLQFLVQAIQEVAAGQSSKEVAYLLNLSVRTVEKHRANMMEKIGVRDVASLTRYAIQNGLIKI